MPTASAFVYLLTDSCTDSHNALTVYTLKFDLPSQAQPLELTLSDSDGSLPRYTCKRLPPEDENDLRLSLVDSLSNAELASLNLLKPCVSCRCYILWR